MHFLRLNNLIVKVLAKLGLVTAAAATVLFIFIYEFQGPVINKVMSEAPVAPAQNESIEESAVEPILEEPQERPAISEESPLETKESEISEPAVLEDDAVSEEDLAETPEVEVTPTEATPAGPTRRVYGKITLSTSGEQLGGVNIMVPGSTVAKVSNPNGGYTIEVPESTRSLVFIYRGKKLVQPINPNNSLVNVSLNLATMQYD